MTWNNEQLNYQQQERPTRVRLPDGSTRTQEAITDELLKEAGWEFMIDLPEPGAMNDPNT